MVRKFVWVLAAVALIFSGVYGVRAWTKQRAERAVVTARTARVDAAHDAIARAMKDPQSVQFRDTIVRESDGTVCGSVNAKNSMGGYVGFKRYLAHGKRYLIEDTSVRDWFDDNEVAALPENLTELVKLSGAASSESTQKLADGLLFEHLWIARCREQRPTEQQQP